MSLYFIDLHALVKFMDDRLTVVVPVEHVRCSDNYNGFGSVSMKQGDLCEVHWSNKKWYTAEYIFSDK